MAFVAFLDPLGPRNKEISMGLKGYFSCMLISRRRRFRTVKEGIIMSDPHPTPDRERRCSQDGCQDQRLS